MKVEKILLDTKFAKSFEKYKAKLTPKEKVALQEKLMIFKENIFDESLKTHKLRGGLQNYYSFRISYKDRIRFKIVDIGVVFFYEVGNHDRVY